MHSSLARRTGRCLAARGCSSRGPRATLFTAAVDAPVNLSSLADGIPPLNYREQTQSVPAALEEVPRAPRRPVQLTDDEVGLALRNALRYFPDPATHEELCAEFKAELDETGHIYMDRFRPVHYEIKAHPITAYPARCEQAAAVQLMIMNVLDRAVAQFPHELFTYGGNGSVFSNWAQYHLTMKYLSEMTDCQTLVMYSGHPMGLFPSHPDAPRVVISNGMMVPNHSTKENYEKLFATGNTQYGNMTAGSWMYIGPQGIVHGTMITILNACRRYLTDREPGREADFSDVVYLTSGLGGMSGAQPKAGLIAGTISVTAEIDPRALQKRYDQGWVQEIVRTPAECVERVKRAKQERTPVSIAYQGNVVDLWEAFADESDADPTLKLIDLGSDQTSLHNPWMGGYYPVQLTFDESLAMMREDPEQFKGLVQETLRRHIAAINRLSARGTKFWDYGNGFLLESSRAGADVLGDSPSGFKYPSYVQEIMGDIFSLGFGPYRWVCTSGENADLVKTDAIAADVMSTLGEAADEPVVKGHFEDNLKWVQEADKNQLVVGSQARILYANCEARVQIALKMNAAIADGHITAPVVLSRDHHDVSGTDSPYRETSNIYDGSVLTADMAVHNAIGDSFRGATVVAIHNGGGVGWGEVINGGFSLVLDGTADAGRRAELMLGWDVCNGVSRRAWARNSNAEMAIKKEMEANPLLKVTLPAHVHDDIISKHSTGC